MHFLTYDLISHPNGWHTAQQPIMREATILAGLVPNSQAGENRIIFVSEGEASLHWCMSRGVGRKDLRVWDHFIVVDAGGGTIDISSFKNISTIPLEFEESSIPECYLEGSAFVTQAFKEYVQGDDRLPNRGPWLSRIFDINAAKLKGSSFGHPAMIQRMVDHFDRYDKRNFEDPNQNMPVRFGRHKDNDPDVGITEGRIIVSG
ncbi:hypothetical protein FRC02_011744 [Tulasnella sp. 418]|nr:hypothetical protein FRC02_011744 [Tulasnella sp. 418]